MQAIITLAMPETELIVTKLILAKLKTEKPTLDKKNRIIESFQTII